MRRLLVISALVFVSACGGNKNDPTSPTNFAQVGGGWSGTFESNYQPEAIFMDVTQAGSSVSGTWSAPSSLVRANGTIAGTVTQFAFTGIITYSYSSSRTVCQGSFSGIAGGVTMTWTSPGFTGNCDLLPPGNPINVRFILQRR